MSETILYRNWRGETSVRRIKIDAIAYGNEALGLHYCSNEWHPEEQWILFAADIDKCERRGFALSGILAWGEQAVADHATALAEAEARGRRQGLELLPIETAPKDETDVLLFGTFDGRPRPPIVAGWFEKLCDDPGWYSHDDINNRAEIDPTHWAPLPSLATATAETQKPEEAA